MSDPRATRFEEAVALFDARAYFEAHEAWEEIWKVAPAGAWRHQVQGLIQAAAAFHKLFVRGDAASAARLLARACEKLEGERDPELPLDIAALREALEACLVGLRARGAADEPLDFSWVPELRPLAR